MFGTSENRLVRVKAKEGGIAECDAELEGRSIAENTEKKKIGTRKRKHDDREDTKPYERLRGNGVQARDHANPYNHQAGSRDVFLLSIDMSLG